MRIIDRFDKYIKTRRLNDNRVTIDLGISVGLLGKTRKSSSDLSRKTIEKILNFYTDLDRVWLLTGEGNMIKSTNIVSEPEVKYEESQNNYGRKKEDHIYETINNLSASSNRDSINIAELIETTKKMADTAERNSRTLEKLVDMIKESGLNIPDSLEFQKGDSNTTVEGKTELTDEKATSK